MAPEPFAAGLTITRGSATPSSSAAKLRSRVIRLLQRAVSLLQPPLDK